MTAVRLGAVGYLNARPLVFGLERSPRFAVRFDVPSVCSQLLEAGDIDLGLISSIEYARGDGYLMVPDLAIASKGPVASVALYTTRAIADVRSIAMDTSSRTSVALVRVLCHQLFRIAPAMEARAPDLESMLAVADAALVIGDNALLWNPATVRLPSASHVPGRAADRVQAVEKIDLGDAWTSLTGLPFVWACWTGRADALTPDDIRALQAVRDQSVCQPVAVAREHFRDTPQYVDVGARYLRENIKYYLGDEERAGLETFYRYAAEIGVAPPQSALRFYGQV